MAAQPSSTPAAVLPGPETVVKRPAPPCKSAIHNRCTVGNTKGAYHKHAWEGWEKQVLSARGFKRVGRHLEYAI
jgi:hypothetical protein